MCQWLCFVPLSGVSRTFSMCEHFSGWIINTDSSNAISLGPPVYQWGGVHKGRRQAVCLKRGAVRREGSWIVFVWRECFVGYICVYDCCVSAGSGLGESFGYDWIKFCLSSILMCTLCNTQTVNLLNVSNHQRYILNIFTLVYSYSSLLLLYWLVVDVLLILC